MKWQVAKVGVSSSLTAFSILFTGLEIGLPILVSSLGLVLPPLTGLSYLISTLGGFLYGSYSAYKRNKVINERKNSEDASEEKLNSTAARLTALAIDFQKLYLKEATSPQLKQVCDNKENNTEATLDSPQKKSDNPVNNKPHMTRLTKSWRTLKAGLGGMAMGWTVVTIVIKFIFFLLAVTHPIGWIALAITGIGAVGIGVYSAIKKWQATVKEEAFYNNQAIALNTYKNAYVNLYDSAVKSHQQKQQFINAMKEQKGHSEELKNLCSKLDEIDINHYFIHLPNPHNKFIKPILKSSFFGASTGSAVAHILVPIVFVLMIAAGFTPPGFLLYVAMGLVGIITGVTTGMHKYEQRQYKQDQEYQTKAMLDKLATSIEAFSKYLNEQKIIIDNLKGLTNTNRASAYCQVLQELPKNDMYRTNANQANLTDTVDAPIENSQEPVAYAVVSRTKHEEETNLSSRPESFPSPQKRYNWSSF